MERNLDFGELSHDEDLKKRIIDFEESLDKVEKMLETFCTMNIYDDLSREDKVRYNLFQSFTINSLFWFYLRTQGIDPNQHDIRSEINRVRDFMVKSKKIYEKQNLMPRIDQDAAKRFVRSGLWEPNQSTSQKNVKIETVSRKRKRESEDEDDES